mgnify:CR=1 FL=1
MLLALNYVSAISSEAEAESGSVPAAQLTPRPPTPTATVAPAHGLMPEDFWHHKPAQSARWCSCVKTAILLANSVTMAYLGV